jgi:hypothetical protein
MLVWMVGAFRVATNPWRANRETLETRRDVLV